MCQEKKAQEHEFEHFLSREGIFALTQTGGCHSVYFHEPGKRKLLGSAILQHDSVKVKYCL